MNNRRSHIMSGDDYEAFLLEWRHRGTTYYWSLDADGEVVWALDPDDAIHFARRSDAETIVEHAADDRDFRIVDHCWPGGTPRNRGALPCSGEPCKEEPSRLPGPGAQRHRALNPSDPEEE